MLKPQLYYDYPQEAWHDLFIEAEDYLYEEHPNLCIVGAWPAGPLVYGIPTEKPGIFVLCTDDIDKILDPAYYNKRSVEKEINPQICIWGINNWIFNILCMQNVLVDSLFPLLLPLQTPIYLDDSINNILESATEVIKEGIKNIALFNIKQSTYQQKLYRALEYRTCLMFIHTGMFYPCINKDYDSVKFFSDIPEYANDKIAELDNKIISSVINVEKISSDDLLEYSDILLLLMKTYMLSNQDKQHKKTLEERLRKLVISLYKTFT